ncbi:hypothetical protein As57867_022548, partial [Aphanomyces stellatus]
KCGRPKKRQPHEVMDAIKQVPHHDRQTQRTLAANSNIPRTAIQRHMAEVKTLKARTSRLKPLLTPANALERLKYAWSFLRPGSCGSHIFVDLYDQVHVDEKWFFITTVNKKFYVYDDEEIALRAVKSKNFITKVMFIAAVARPRWDAHRKTFFDGKLGIWPFVEYAVAQRTSKNRPKGTIETKTKTVDGAVYKESILNKVIPAIKARFPIGGQPNGVFVQQDNASPHKCVTTEALIAHGVTGISMANQPANSPDFNVLDLGFFNAIQSLQQKKKMTSIDSLITAVEQSFFEMPPETLAKTFVTLQSVIEIALENNGGNDFKVPHLQKDATIHDWGAFNLTCRPSVYTTALARMISLV